MFEIVQIVDYYFSSNSYSAVFYLLKKNDLIVNVNVSRINLKVCMIHSNYDKESLWLVGSVEYITSFANIIKTLIEEFDLKRDNIPSFDLLSSSAGVLFVVVVVVLDVRLSLLFTWTRVSRRPL